LPARSSRYLLDNNVFIAAVKRGWTKSTELVYHLLDGQAELFADELLITSGAQRVTNTPTFRLGMK